MLSKCLIQEKKFGFFQQVLLSSVIVAQKAYLKQRNKCTSENNRRKTAMIPNAPMQTQMFPKNTSQRWHKMNFIKNLSASFLSSSLVHFSLSLYISTFKINISTSLLVKTFATWTNIIAFWGSDLARLKMILKLHTELRHANCILTETLTVPIVKCDFNGLPMHISSF